MVFNHLAYFVTQHAQQRAVERIPGLTESLAINYVKKLAHHGTILLDIDNYRYIKSEGYFLPCVKSGDNGYTIKSLLTWDMVDRGDGGFQYQIDKYHS